MANENAMRQAMSQLDFGTLRNDPSMPQISHPPNQKYVDWDKGQDYHRLKYGGTELTDTEERLEQVFGLEKGRTDRGFILPHKGDDGWVAPELLYTMGRGAMLPIQASTPGSVMSVGDVSTAVADYAGMGLGANTFGKFIPENALGAIGGSMKALPRSRSGVVTGSPQLAHPTKQLIYKKDPMQAPYAAQVGRTAAQISKRQNIFQELAEEGIDAKDWYKNVNEFMRKFFPDETAMERELAVGILSPTSASASVSQNVKNMLKAYAQIKAGQATNVGLFPSQTQNFFTDYERLIANGLAPQDAKDRIFHMAHKFRNFAKNNAGDLDAVTNDRWMKRLAGFFRKGSPTVPQYNYMTALLKDTAARMGIKPAEAQAAVWTAFKARWEAVQPPIQAWARKKGWLDEEGNPRIQYEEKYHNKVFNAAMKHTPSEKELKFAGQSFGDLAQKGGMGVEFSPGLKFWPELGGASNQVQEAYHEGMQKIFFRTNKDGRISHAQLDDMGIPHSVTPRTTGVFQGETSPGYYIELLLPEDSFGVIDQAILNRLHAGIATIGRTSGQDAIGYYKMVDAPVGQADMYHMNIGRTLTDSETTKLEAGLQGLGLNHTVIPINRLDGVDIYYTDFKGGNGILDKDRFVLEVEQYLSRGEWADTDTAMISEGIGKYKGEYFSYENLGPTGKEYKDGSREIHWQNLANKSGAGAESARVHAVYSQQVKRFQSEFAETNGLPDPHFRHLEKPQHPLSIEKSLRGGFSRFPSRQQQLPQIIQPSFRRPGS